MTLNYPTVEHLIENPYYFGVTIGRVAGRIAKGLMTINGLQYQLDINNNNNCLHGGYKGYSHRIWTVQVIEREQEVEVIFSLDSMDKEGGFPGNVLI
jgi:aldose 1-epimerase